MMLPEMGRAACNSEHYLEDSLEQFPHPIILPAITDANL